MPHHFQEDLVTAHRADPADRRDAWDDPRVAALRVFCPL
jgi:hypothetical protein